MLAEAKQPFEIKSVIEVLKGGKVNMYETCAVVRTGKKGRPKRIKFTLFGKDTLEAYMRSAKMLEERGYEIASMDSGVRRAD